MVSLPAEQLSIDFTGSGTTSGALLYNYTYQVNRLKAMDAYKGLTAANNSWANIIALRNYRERIAYDGNGNILTYSRYGNNNSQQLMDSLSYSYNYLSSGTLAGKLSNNRLRRVRDFMSNAAAYDESDVATGVSDLEDQTNADNYTYDEIGNLKSDAKENISLINWNVYGKITDINFNFIANKNKTIYYLYDAAGNRIGKQVEKYGATSGATTTSTYTWYVRDASGNVMATYNSSGTAATIPATLSLGERHLYGSSRLGLLALTADSKNLPQSAPTNVYSSNFIRGNKFFELGNHLGNVLVTISDKKIGVDDGTYDAITGVKSNSTQDGKIDFYNADVVTANDYYPFGMGMPGRKFSAGSGYRYGFNGQEKSNDIKGDGNSLSASFWEYDTRIGRRWNVDPRPSTAISSYSAFLNNPITHVDIMGDTPVKVLNGETWEFSAGSYTTFDGSVQSLKNSSVKVQPPAGTLKSFQSGSNENAVIFEATFGRVSGKFMGYYNTNNPEQDYASYIDGLMEFAEHYESIERLDKKGLWDWTLTDDQAKRRLVGFGINLTSPTVLIRPATIATQLQKAANTKVGKATADFIKLFKPIDDLDFTTTLYRGTTGTEGKRPVLFLTDDVNVAATYVANGGQVMKYEMTQYSLKVLEQSGNLQRATGIHGPTGIVNTEYIFNGKELINAVNSIGIPNH